MNNGEIIATHQIPESYEPKVPMRIGEYLVGKFAALPSGKSIKRCLKLGSILLNEEPAKTGSWVKKGDVIKLLEKRSAPKKLYHLNMEIVYEDEFIAVINKPAGIPVSGNTFRTVYNSLGYFLKPDDQQNFYPQPAHRLDSATSGLLIVAKTLNSRIALGDQFEKKSIQKTYEAIVHGIVAMSGTIKIDVDGKSAHTKFDCIARHKTCKGLKFSHLVLQPSTGRTHQLRKHCIAMGHPILGDQLYRHRGWQLRKKGMLLCATGLIFKHPVTNEFLELNIKPPAKFAKIMVK